jgi:hypothetical protein
MARVPAKARPAFFEAVERGDDGAVAQRGEAGNVNVDANVDADGAGSRSKGWFDLAFGVNADVPLAVPPHGLTVMFVAVPRMSRRLRTVAVANPAQLGQLDKPPCRTPSVSALSFPALKDPEGP